VDSSQNKNNNGFNEKLDGKKSAFVFPFVAIFAPFFNINLIVVCSWFHYYSPGIK